MKQSNSGEGQPAKNPPAEKPDNTGAAAALAGYDYQVDVSVLAAIRLMLISKSATRITLEPANQDDLEADLVPHQPGRVEPHATLTTGYRLIIQVKRDSGEPWNIGDFEALLNHGKKRKPARTHLKDKKVHYLLVTNAATKGVAMDLEVSGFEETADKDKFPTSLIRTLSADAAGRVAIWSGLTEELLRLKLRELMTDLLHVPGVRQDDLLKALRAEANQRMRYGIPGVWSREDLLATVRGHGGHLASSPNLEAFVPPSNFEWMREQFEAKNAIVIKGPSGTGKTETARMLCELARRRNGALELVVVQPSDAPASTRKLDDTGPTLFYIEDPWGQYSLLGGHEAWTEQLPRLLRDYAGPDHQYVITTRTDVLSDADAGHGLKQWWAELDSGNYKDGQLGRIYSQRSTLLPADMQEKALAFRTKALEVFKTPLQVALYFSNLAQGPETGEADHAFLRRLLRLADREAVAGEVTRYLKALDGCGLAAVLWAMISPRGQFDRNQLVAVRRALRRIDPRLGDGLETLVDRLVAANHLRQPDQSVAFAHPSVKEGFEASIKKDWPRSEDAVGALVRALTQLTGDHRDWGLETAALVLQATATLSRQMPDLDPPFAVDQASHDAIDAWLDAGLMKPESVFQTLLQLASDVGTDASVPSEVARWLLTGVKRGGQVFLDSWTPPVFDDAWYARVSADPRTRQIVDRFVREALPFERATYGPRFAAALDRLATGLTPAFIAAASTMVGGGFDGNVQAVANGAVRDLSAYRPVLDGALDDLAAVHRKHATDGVTQWLAIDDGELDADAEEYYRDAHEDDGYASGVFVDAFVGAKRAVGEWQHLRDHPRAKELLAAWARYVANSPTAAVEEEIGALVALAHDSDAEHYAWWALRQHWRPGFAAMLEERLITQPIEPQLRSELAYCALVKSPDTLVAALAALVDPARLVTLLVDMQEALHRIDSKSRARRLRRVTGKLPTPLPEIVAALPTKRESATGVSAAARSLLEAAAGAARPDILNVIVPVIIASGGKPGDAIRRWLDESEDKDFAVAAVKSAIAIDDGATVEHALGHVRAEARRTALLALADKLPDALPTGVLALAKDKGSKVRRAMVDILGKRPSPFHQQLLLELTDDRWSDADARYDEPESNPIAREAVEALDAYAELTDAVGERLLALADTTRDRVLSNFALIIASTKCGPAIREKIWTIACRPAARWIRVDALEALAGSTEVEAAIVDQATPEVIMAMPPVVAIQAVKLVAQHAQVSQAVRALETIGSANPCRGLLLIGALTLQSRDKAAASHILGLLGPKHPAAGLLSSTDPLPLHALDDLGSPRLRKQLREHLGERIATAKTGED